MKQLRTALILVVVLLALGGLATWDEWQTEKDEAHKKTEKLLVGGSADSVTAIHYVSTGDGAEAGAVDVKLALTDGAWRIQSPVSAPADKEVVDNLVKAIVEFQYDKQVADTKANWAKYELDQPARKITLTYTEGDSERQRTLLVGAKSAIGYSLYAALEGEDKAYLGGQHLWLAATKTLSEFRDKSVVSFATEQVAKLSYNAKGESQIDFARAGGRWQITSPEGIDGDHAEILDFVETVRGLKATGFIDEPDSSVQQAFAEPTVVVEWTLAEGAPVRLAFAKVNGEFIGSYNPSALAFKFGESVEASLTKALFDFRDRRIFTVDSGEVHRVDIDGEMYQRVKGNWYKEADAQVFDTEGNLMDGQTEPESFTHVRALTVDIEFAKTDEFLKEGDPELPSLPAAPQNRVSLEFKDAPDRRLVIDLYSDPNNENRFFVRHSESSTIYSVNKTVFDSVSPSDGVGMLDDQGALDADDAGAVSLGSEPEADEGA